MGGQYKASRKEPRLFIILSIRDYIISSRRLNILTLECFPELKN